MNDDSSMSDKPDPDRLTAWRMLLEAHASLTEALETELQADCGIPLAWYDVLVQLSEAEAGRLRMQDLARSVLLSKSGLTRLVDRMEQAGLVQREPSQTDRRSTWATLTPPGRATLRRAAPGHLAGIQRHFAAYLSDEEVRVIREALGRILAAIPRRSGNK